MIEMIVGSVTHFLVCLLIQPLFPLEIPSILGSQLQGGICNLNQKLTVLKICAGAYRLDKDSYHGASHMAPGQPRSANFTARSFNITAAPAVFPLHSDKLAWISSLRCGPILTGRLKAGRPS
jgi:hypothetical protein